MALALLPAALILGISSTTYFGVRTYPSFAMFSNLLIEGGVSNHWLVGPLRHDAGGGRDADPLPPLDSTGAARASGRPKGGWTANGMAYGPHRAIEIISTDLPALRDLQINLAPLLPPHVLAAFAVADVSPEFYITPPRWNYAPTEAFRPFSVPLVEARRRLAADGNPPDFYVRYREIRGGRAERKGGSTGGAAAGESRGAMPISTSLSAPCVRSCTATAPLTRDTRPAGIKTCNGERDVPP